MTNFLSDHVGREDAIVSDLYKLKYIEQTLFNEIVYFKLENTRKENRYLTFNELGEIHYTNIRQ